MESGRDRAEDYIKNNKSFSEEEKAQATEDLKFFFATKVIAPIVGYGRSVLGLESGAFSGRSTREASIRDLNRENKHLGCVAALVNWRKYLDDKKIEIKKEQVIPFLDILDLADNYVQKKAKIAEHESMGRENESGEVNFSSPEDPTEEEREVAVQIGNWATEVAYGRDYEEKIKA